MPRYFFNMIGLTAELDDIGTELPSSQYARREGAKLLGALVADGLLDRHDERLRLEIADDTGAVLFRFEMKSLDAPLLRVA